MLATVEGIYRDGKIILTEKPDVENHSKVIVTFLKDQGSIKTMSKRDLGIFRGMIKVPNDFNDEIDEVFECLK
jgi:hypothetical protein